MNKYPTDEELELFIQELEQQELYAPKHIKEQILSQAFQKQAEEARQKSGGGGTVQLMAYRLKIVAGMAAALLMLILLPSIRMSGEYRMYRDEIEWQQDNAARALQEEEQGKLDVNRVLNEGARQMNQKLNDWFGWLGDWKIGNLFEEENGGIGYEN